MLLEYLKFMYEWDKDDKAMETYWQYCDDYIDSEKLKEMLGGEFVGFLSSMILKPDNYQKIKEATEKSIKMHYRLMAEKEIRRQYEETNKDNF